jgi:hypothetical protein
MTAIPQGINMHTSVVTLTSLHRLIWRLMSSSFVVTLMVIQQAPLLEMLYYSLALELH